MGIVNKLFVGEGGSWGDGDAYPAAGTGWWIKFQVALRSPHLQAWSIRWKPMAAFNFAIPQNGFQVRVVSGSFWWLGRKKEKTTPMLPPVWIMVLLCFRVGLSLYVILKMATWELEGPQRLLPPFKGEHLEWVRTSWLAPIFPIGKPLGSQMIGWKFPVSPTYSHYD